MAKAKKPYARTGRPRGRPAKKSKLTKQPAAPASNTGDMPSELEVSTTEPQVSEAPVKAAEPELDFDLFVNDDALSKPMLEPAIPSVNLAELTHIPGTKAYSAQFKAVEIPLTPSPPLETQLYTVYEKPKSTNKVQSPHTGATNTRTSTESASASSISNKAKAHVKAKARAKATAKFKAKATAKPKAKAKVTRTARKRKPITYQANKRS